VIFKNGKDQKLKEKKKGLANNKTETKTPETFYRDF